MSENVIDFNAEKLRQGDHIVRGTAADGMIRGIAVTARQTVQTARENHSASPLVTAALGRLMMGALMIGAQFKDDEELITLTVKGDGPIGGLTVTANNKGQVKGFANHPNVWLNLNSKGKLDVRAGIGNGTLTVVRDLPYVEPYTSTTELVSGEIGDDLANYFVLSDQVPTSVGVGVLVDTDTSVKQAGGFIIQLMPGYDEYLIDELEKNLTDVTSVTDMLEKGMSPDDILQYLLRGLDYHELQVTPAEFHCSCDDERASRAVMALGTEELQGMIAANEPAVVHCHFCGKEHIFSIEQLKSLLADAEDGE